jgi:hypothetical protein
MVLPANLALKWKKKRNRLGSVLLTRIRSFIFSGMSGEEEKTFSRGVQIKQMALKDGQRKKSTFCR